MSNAHGDRGNPQGRSAWSGSSTPPDVYGNFARPGISEEMLDALEAERTAEDLAPPSDVRSAHVVRERMHNHLAELEESGEYDIRALAPLRHLLDQDWTDPNVRSRLKAKVEAEDRRVAEASPAGCEPGAKQWFASFTPEQAEVETLQVKTVSDPGARPPNPAPPAPSPAAANPTATAPRPATADAAPATPNPTGANPGATTRPPAAANPGPAPPRHPAAANPGATAPRPPAAANPGAALPRPPAAATPGAVAPHQAPAKPATGAPPHPAVASPTVATPRPATTNPAAAPPRPPATSSPTAPRPASPTTAAPRTGGPASAPASEAQAHPRPPAPANPAAARPPQSAPAQPAVTAGVAPVRASQPATAATPGGHSSVVAPEIPKPTVVRSPGSPPTVNPKVYPAASEVLSALDKTAPPVGAVAASDDLVFDDDDGEDSGQQKLRSRAVKLLAQKPPKRAKQRVRPWILAVGAVLIVGALAVPESTFAGPPMAPAPPRLVLSSEPRAEVRSGGESLGQTPLLLEESQVREGVTLNAPGYEPKTFALSEKISPDRIEKRHLVLSMAQLKLDWTGLPSESKLTWQGKPSTRETLAQALPGKYTLGVQAPDRPPITLAVEVSAADGSGSVPVGKQVEAALARQPALTLAFKTGKGAAPKMPLKVTVSGGQGASKFSKTAALDAKSGSKLVLPGPGTYQVKIPASQTHEAFSKKITVKEGSSQSLDIALTPVPPKVAAVPASGGGGGGGYVPEPSYYSPPPAYYSGGGGGGGGGSGGSIAPPSF